VQLGLNPHCSLPLLIIRSNGDEASAVLAAAQFSSWAMQRLCRIFTFILSSAEDFYDKAGPLASVRRFLYLNVLFLILFALLFRAELFTSPLLLLTVPLLSFLLAYLVGAGMFLLELSLVSTLVVLQPVVALLLTPFGPDLAPVTLIADLSVEPAPPGLWQMCQTQPRHFGQTTRERLFSYLHASTHDQPEIAAFIVSWLQNRAGGSVSSADGISR
jgi:hypothetical protein